MGPGNRGRFKPHGLPNSTVPFSQKPLQVAYITAENQCLLMSLQEGRNINFMNPPSVYTLITRIKCYLGWVGLSAASEVVLNENMRLNFGMAGVAHYKPRNANSISFLYRQKVPHYQGKSWGMRRPCLSCYNLELGTDLPLSVPLRALAFLPWGRRLGLGGPPSVLHLVV